MNTLTGVRQNRDPFSLNASRVCLSPRTVSAHQGLTPCHLGMTAGQLSTQYATMDMCVTVFCCGFQVGVFVVDVFGKALEFCVVLLLAFCLSC